jgi:hypothetical protein
VKEIYGMLKVKEIVVRKYDEKRGTSGNEERTDRKNPSR